MFSCFRALFARITHQHHRSPPFHFSTFAVFLTDHVRSYIYVFAPVFSRTPALSLKQNMKQEDNHAYPIVHNFGSPDGVTKVAISPSAGVEIGDRLVSIGGVDTGNKSIDDIRKILIASRGQESLRLGFFRRGYDPNASGRRGGGDGGSGGGGGGGGG